MKARITNSMTIYSLNKLIGHGFYLFPFIGKTKLTKISFYEDHKASFTFYNKRLNIDCCTRIMGYDDLFTFLTENTYKRYADLCRELYKKSHTSMKPLDWTPPGGFCWKYIVSPSESLVGVPLDIGTFKPLNLTYLPGTMECINNIAKKGGAPVYPENHRLFTLWHGAYGLEGPYIRDIQSLHDKLQRIDSCHMFTDSVAAYASSKHGLIQDICKKGLRRYIDSRFLKLLDAL